MSITIQWLWAASAGMSFFLTWLVMCLAAGYRLLDIPNQRSAHDRPVPRGGGIAIVVTFMAAVVAATLSANLAPNLLSAILGGALVAAIGLADDYREVTAGWRLLLHTVAALWAIYWLGGLPDDLLPGVPMFLVNSLGVLCTVWLINLYNFMDGIDGIASIETMTACVGGVVLYVSSASDGTAWIYPALLLASVSGFLFWNYPPARIFLGDCGSGFLGFTMAVFCVQAAQLAPALFWGWIILLGVFIVDSGVTLVRRMWHRQRLHEAHRSHAYQVAARKVGRHAPVSLAVGTINLAWLLPVSFLVVTGRIPVIAGLVVAYAPLVWLAIHFKAGVPAYQDT
jgi:Fuc2NAc and GlcNAc transferase